MRAGPWAAVGIVIAMGTSAPARSPKSAHLNPMIELHVQKKPLFGLYAPANRRTGRRGAGGDPSVPAPAPPPQQSPAELVKDALAYDKSDFLFDGSMEGGVDRGIGPFGDFATAMMEQAAPAVRWQHPLSVKTPKIADDPAKAVDNISRQLNLGAATVVFVGVESASEVKQGLAAMRFKSRGGTRPDEVGLAPKYWGLSEKEYRDKADVWPLNESGELTNWTIVESREGLAHVREIADRKSTRLNSSHESESRMPSSA